MICNQCGFENADNAKICTNCGYVFDNDVLMFSENEQTINSEASHKQAQIDEIKNRRNAKRKRKKIRKVAIAVLVVLLFAGAIYGAFYLSNKKDVKFDDHTSQPSTTQSPVPTQTPEVIPTPEPTISPEPIETVLPSELPETTEEVSIPQNDNADTSNSNNTTNTLGVNTEVTTEVKKEATPAPASTKKPQSDVSSSADVVSKPKATKKPISKPKPTPTPIPDIKSAVSLAGETITDENGATYSTIVMGGKMAYLKVSTPLENNSYSVVSAKPTGQKINNLPVYEPSSVAEVPETEFILPQSSVRLLTDEDIAGLTNDELNLARNEIYARHGRLFKNQDIQKYFDSKAWYAVNSSYVYKNDAQNVSDIENQNAHFLLNAQK